MMDKIIIRDLGRQAYEPIWRAMQSFTDTRDDSTPDELWIVEHSPVFTQGQAGKEEHLLAPGDIPVVPVDRGGQVTYHGPGQLVVYFMLNIRRLSLGVRQLVNEIENTIVDVLKDYDIEAAPRRDAPGVYVNGDKVCSLGLRIRKGCSFHGLALNVNMDMEPFSRINPCGLTGIKMIQTADLGGPQSFDEAAERVTQRFISRVGYRNTQSETGLAEAYVKAS
ncbi:MULTISPECIES: lipoyl(octanoyl) transferase LipB [unclassified Idiomarina]|jgi:lipoyl(octanoyl) transferase|uniref:lipoyl(octanoyl) transferase LipB n=1 Tax=unclassified Idiomarina TaxID=2614829 RepID=UPI0008F94C38|nr:MULTISPECIES: lipoyl(octanoyl) transferase LipB [unclassified Idiomarina]MAD54908.1 lipoyl(octanoyl) transferase LipB [Idiomarinaceae bacterium]MEC7643014.1 lipoyl(octanoyl) transferase LipB [Pseudomonadota bacterium]NQZ03746.1 lipoyl(octanoyl) transferase LipB [Idiomarina sp.]OIM99818.1 octanoyltransferase [Idiomarina sp. MD25a]|tara:strand:- start:499 stop:1164 length:666 start_codon:yes stop_codon:yes gene_type:complete